MPSARDITDPRRQRSTSARNKRPVEPISTTPGAVEYGVLQWFNGELGFGFITPDDDGPDVFVHVSQFAGADPRVEVGQPVSYRVDPTRCRPEAKTAYAR